jgi:hypothetical protein
MTPTVVATFAYTTNHISRRRRSLITIGIIKRYINSSTSTNNNFVNTNNSTTTTIPRSDDNRYDVVVVGLGSVGSYALRALSRSSSFSSSLG